MCHDEAEIFADVKITEFREMPLLPEMIDVMRLYVDVRVT